LRGGDTLIVKAGTYTEAMLNNIPSGTGGAPTTIRNAPGEVVTLVQPASNQDCSIYQENRSYLVIDGIHMDGAWHAGFGVCTAATSTNQTFRNFKVYHHRNQGAMLYKGGSGITLESLEIYENGNDPTRAGYRHGIYMGASNSTIKGCIVRDHPLGYGIQLFPEPSHVTVIGNRFYNNRNNIYVGGPGHVIANNLVYNARGGIAISSSDVKVYNNTVYGHTDSGIYWMNNEQGVVRNNIAFGNRHNIASPTPGATVVNNLTVDPLFVDAAHGDFRLRPGSPAIDKGETHSLVREDFGGMPRPQGAGYDIGAWEYRAGSAPAPVLAPRNLRAVSQP
jgi:parallel beta-helix repeat protein